MTTAVGKSPAYARLSAVASAGDLPTAPTPPPGTRPSALIAARVAAARLIQRRRGAINAEADVGAMEVQPDARALAEQAAEKLRLSARGFTRVLRVARTIADLANVPVIRRLDVAEALAFRHRVPGRQF